MNITQLIGLTGLLALSSTTFAQSNYPDAIKVPDGHKIAMETTGVGEITYECRDNDRSGKQVGTYFGPPATWQAKDGSKVTGTQLAVAPSSPGNLPYQLVKANPAEGKGAMSGVSYIQRVALKGGVAPGSECTAANKGKQEVVKYQADYIFWAAN